MTTARRTSRARLKKRLDTALAELTHVELVKPAADLEQSYLFKHALIVDTAQSTLLHGEYKRLNRLVANAYESVYSPQELDEFAPVLAQHFAAAGDREKTVEYATRAGDLAAEIYANTEACAHYTQAVQALPLDSDSGRTSQLYLKRGRILELMGDYDAALENYDEMAALAQARSDRAMELAARMASTTVYSTPNPRHDPAHARALAEQTLALARQLNDRPAQAKILWNLLLSAHFAGQRLDAIVYGEQSIAIARELDLRQQLAYSLNDVSRPYMMTGSIEKGIAALQEAQALWRTLDNLPMLADNLNTLATMHFVSGDFDRALVLAQEGFQIGERMNNAWAQAHSQMLRSLVLTDRGEISLAIAATRQGIELAHRVGFLVAGVTLQSNLALTYASIGSLAPAIELLENSVPEGGRVVDWQAQTYAVLGQLYARSGDIERAREVVQASLVALSQSAASPFLMGSLPIAQLEIAWAEQDLAQVLKVAAEILDAAGERQLDFYRRYTLLMQARALVGLGRSAEAVPILEQARLAAERVSARRDYWQILALLAAIESRSGNAQRAAELYATARTTIQFILDHTPPGLGQTFVDMPEVSRVLRMAGAE